MSKSKKVAVLMSTYNGEKYIKYQIESILSQNNVEVSLYIRDDGSTDGTTKRLSEYSKNPNVFIDFGSNIGFQRSFMTLVKNVPEIYDYYAFSDQDDYWKNEKLYQAVKKLENNKNIDLYTSALDVVNENLEHQYYNDFPHLRITFGSAISRQRLAGCTMVFTPKILSLSKAFPIENYYNIFSHDAVVYYLTLLIGSNVYFDKESNILFRRHSGTVTEHGQGLIKRIKSVTSIFFKDKSWKYRQIEALLSDYEDCMTKDIRNYCLKIKNYKSGFFSTINMVADSRVRSGIAIVDFINAIAILMRCY